MQEEEYRNAILKAKELQSGPLELLNMPIGPKSVYGYNISDHTFLSQQWAKEAGAFYFDVIDFLDAVHLGDQKRIDFYTEQLQSKQKIITPPIAIATNETQNNLSFYWRELFTELKKVWKDPVFAERRLVIPLQLQFGKMVPHASVACFNFRPQKDEADVIVLEQHAQQKGDPDYEADLDYTSGIKLHASAFGATLRQNRFGFLGIGTVNTFVNDKPICRRHNVCGVVASELARRLLETDDSMKLAKSGIVITNEEVDKLHERNQKLEAKYGYFPLMVIQKNGGRK